MCLHPQISSEAILVTKLNFEYPHTLCFICCQHSVALVFVATVILANVLHISATQIASN